MDLRPYQAKAKYDVYQTFKEGTQNIMLQLPTGCHSKGTLILMYDGSVKPVEEIRINDLIMGPDSSPRKVLRLYNGIDDMYRISPIKGEPFEVNKSHILSLKATNQHKIAKYPSRMGGAITNINVSDYLTKSKHFKHINKLYRVPIDFNNEYEYYPITPYFLGVLLGDGSLSRQIAITTMDNEIVDEIYAQAKYYDLQIRCEEMINNKAKNYHFVVNLKNHTALKKSNKLKNAIIELGVNASSELKFIPEQYRLGSKQVRFEILAGLLDTDGSLSHNGFEYSSKSENLANDVVFIAKSLGFMATKSDKIVNGSTYYRVHINGNTHLIPTRVAHKKATPRQQIKDVLMTGFKIESIGRGEYFGFGVDKDNLYLLADFTVTHNSGKTVLFSSMIADGHKSKRRTLILAHRSELIDQANDKLYSGHKIYSGLIQAGHPMSHHHYSQIGSVQTMINRQLVNPIDLCIIDEAHHMQESNTYGKIKDYLLTLNPNCKFLGVTATPCRTNGGGFEKVFDKLIQGVSVTYLIQNKFLTPPKYYISPLDLGKVKITAGDYNQKELSEAYQNKVHPKDLVDNWLQLTPGLQTIGFAVDIAHSLRIVEEFRANGIKAAHIDGTTEKTLRKRIIRDYQDKRIQVLYNVGVFDEGFDVPEIEVIQLAAPTKSLIKFMQRVGRGLRPAKGKEFAIILDHSGLVAEHDIVERDREWSLEGVTKTSNKKKTMFQDKTTGKLYEPKQIPLDIPARCIQLVELDSSEIQLTPDKNLAKELSDLIAFAEYKNYKKGWVWYRFAAKVRVKSESIARLRLLDRARLYCETFSYNFKHAEYLVEDYIKVNKSLYTNP